MKMQENVWPIFVLEEAEEVKIWWNPQVRRRTRSLALSANEVEGQTTTSASRT